MSKFARVNSGSGQKSQLPHFLSTTTATTQNYTLSLHDALPILAGLDELHEHFLTAALVEEDRSQHEDGKSTRLNSSHRGNSYAVVLFHNAIAVGTDRLAAVRHEEADMVGELGGGRDRGAGVFDG